MVKHDIVTWILSVSFCVCRWFRASSGSTQSLCLSSGLTCGAAARLAVIRPTRSAQSFKAACKSCWKRWKGFRLIYLFKTRRLHHSFLWNLSLFDTHSSSHNTLSLSSVQVNHKVKLSYNCDESAECSADSLLCIQLTNRIMGGQFK